MKVCYQSLHIGYSIPKMLHSLRVPRDALRLVTQWMCNCVPHADNKCAQCRQATISKAHLEACAVQSSLPDTNPGKGIDNLLQRAVCEGHAPSALQAVKILYEEVVYPFPPRRSLP